MIFLLLAFVLLFVSTPAFSQDFCSSLEIQPDKKVIHVDSLGLPGSTFAKDILSTIPELIGREGDELYPNYDVQYDGKSVGESRDVFLLETRLYQLSKIEISSSPDVEHQRNGQGGVINFVPVPLQEGVSGGAYADVSTEPDFVPGVNVNYKKGKFEMRNHLNMEYYRPTKRKLYEEKDMKSFSSGIDTTINSFCQETAKTDISYKFSEQDILKAWIVESWSREKTQNISTKLVNTYIKKEPGHSEVLSDTLRTSSNSRRSNLMVNALMEYEHNFNNLQKFVVNAGYQYNRQGQDDNVVRPQTLTTEVKYEGRIWASGDHILNMKGGANCNLSKSTSVERNGQSIYASPYLEFKYLYQGLQLNVGGRYQYFKRNFSYMNLPDYDNDDHDFTCNVNAKWQIVPNHALRLILAHNLKRPSDEMLFPEFIHKSGTKMDIKGNSNLENAYLNTAEIFYIYNWRNDAGHSIVLNLGMGYERTDGIVETVVMERGEGQNPYLTYQNSGINNVGIFDFSLIYSYGIFKVSLTGNLFHNNMKLASGMDTYTYFNLGLTPIFQFKRGWTLISNMIYNSAVIRTNEVKGDCFFADLRLTKSIRNWDLYFAISDIFDYTTTDYSKVNGKTYYGIYDLYTRYLSIGFNYRFGSQRNK